MTTRTKAAGERGNRHLSGKHKVTGTRKPAVAHVKDLSAPNFALPENLYAPHPSREAWLTHLREVAAIAADRTLNERIEAEADTVRERIDARPLLWWEKAKDRE